MKINVMKISYVQETFKDLSKKKIFKVLDMMSVTEKLPLQITLWWIEIKALDYSNYNEKQRNSVFKTNTLNQNNKLVKVGVHLWTLLLTCLIGKEKKIKL